MVLGCGMLREGGCGGQVQGHQFGSKSSVSSQPQTDQVQAKADERGTSSQDLLSNVCRSKKLRMMARQAHKATMTVLRLNTLIGQPLVHIFTKVSKCTGSFSRKRQTETNTKEHRKREHTWNSTARSSWNHLCASLPNKSQKMWHLPISPSTEIHHSNTKPC